MANRSRANPLFGASCLDVRTSTFCQRVFHEPPLKVKTEETTHCSRGFAASHRAPVTGFLGPMGDFSRIRFPSFTRLSGQWQGANFLALFGLVIFSRSRFVGFNRRTRTCGSAWRGPCWRCSWPRCRGGRRTAAAWASRGPGGVEKGGVGGWSEEGGAGFSVGVCQSTILVNGKVDQNLRFCWWFNSRGEWGGGVE